MRKPLSAWLNREGCVCETAHDVASARSTLAAREFDLVICDINLPDGTGPEIVAAMGEPNRGAPVILLTGNPTLQSAIRSVELRVVAYLVKPPDFDELRRLVQREVGAHRQRRAVAASRRHLREWDDELARLEQTIDTPGRQPLVDYLQIAVAQFAAQLAELDRSIALLAADESGRAALSQLDVVTSLRRTVQVLEKTRDHFKSKDLGELRKDLEMVLRSIDENKTAVKVSP